MRIARKFASYSALERRLVMKAWWTLMAVRILLWLAPYRWIDARLMKPPAAARVPVSPGDIALAVTRAATLVPFATCLTQALAGAFLIRRAGSDAIIHFCVARGDAGIKAH
ncbi:MAG TPA: lasso peptide biosynthesis B2 protein, partial [Vicinamibacterales bacterium]|nr:lasso peptide biosynthesis B2 protein [Vicinamibacterales bacterium]